MTGILVIMCIIGLCTLYISYQDHDIEHIGLRAMALLVVNVMIPVCWSALIVYYRAASNESQGVYLDTPQLFLVFFLSLISSPAVSVLISRMRLHGE